MSRIGKKPVEIPKEVKASVAGGVVKIEGPKGNLSQKIPEGFKVEIAEGKIAVTRPSDRKEDKAKHGLVRSLLYNMIIGVTKGYVKELEISGVGFKAQVQGKAVKLSLGYSHPIEYKFPDDITVEIPKPTIIIIKGTDKMKVGQVAMDLRDYYRPEPYKGKGIKFKGEFIRRKAGKAVVGAGGAG